MNPHLHAALQGTHPEDLPRILQYVRWVKLRRLIHSAFYHFPAHWLLPPPHCDSHLGEGRVGVHWV